MRGVPQLVTKIQLRQQFGGSRRVNTAENVCAMTCHSPVKGAGTACLLLLSLEVKSEPGPTAGGEAGGLLSQPLC